MARPRYRRRHRDAAGRLPPSVMPVKASGNLSNSDNNRKGSPDFDILFVSGSSLSDASQPRPFRVVDGGQCVSLTR